MIFRRHFTQCNASIAVQVKYWCRPGPLYMPSPISLALVYLVIPGRWRRKARQACASTSHTSPCFQAYAHYIEEGCTTGGARRNEAHLTPHVNISEATQCYEREILWDPQTSGGLFAAIDPALWPSLKSLAPDVTFWQIGEVTEQVADEAHVRLEVY